MYSITSNDILYLKIFSLKKNCSILNKNFVKSNKSFVSLRKLFLFYVSTWNKIQLIQVNYNLEYCRGELGKMTD